MSDDLFKNLQKLYENNSKRFDSVIKESYDEFDNEPPEMDDQDGGDQEDDQLPPDATAGVGDDGDDGDDEGNAEKVELPPESHPNVFPQPAASKGIIFLNPEAIPNDYGPPDKRKGHVVCVLKVDKSADKVRADSLKNGKVYVPFGIIQKDESGREYVTKDDLKKAFTRGSFVYSLLKLQPLKLDRHLDKPEKNRKQWDEPSKSEAKPAATTDAQPGTPEYYAQINKMRQEKGLPPLPQSQWKLKK